LELKTGAEVASNAISAELAKEILFNYLQASYVTSNKELEDISLIMSTDPVPTIKRLFVENRPLEAVRLAFLALAIHKKPKTKLAIFIVLKENAAVLQWEELNVAQMMKRWR
jgi:hypothetical protein